MTYVANDLNRKITFREMTIAQDPVTGEMIQTWVDFVSVFARVDPLVGREYFAAAAVQAEDTTKFTIRHRADINAGMRIAFDGKTYGITSIQNIRSGNKETLIYAKSIPTV